MMINSGHKQKINSINLANLDEASSLLATVGHDLPRMSGRDKTRVIVLITQVLHDAIEKLDMVAVEKVTHMVYQLARAYPDELTTLLNQPFDKEPFTGQTAGYAWLNEFYSAALDFRSYTALVSLNLIFSLLLAQPTDNLVGGLVAPMEEGSEQGKNALLLIARALTHAAEEERNQPATKIIMDLLMNCMNASPTLFCTALVQTFRQSDFRDKNILYVLVCALKSMSSHNVATVNPLCNMLTTVYQHNHADGSLYHVLQAGPYEGFHPLHILLTGLVSASYVHKNDEAVTSLVMFVDMLLKTEPQAVIAALTNNIEKGQLAGKNGLALLVRAFIAAHDHHLAMDPWILLLSTLTEINPAILQDALTQTSFPDLVKHQVNSPMDYMINSTHNDSLTPLQAAQMSVLISKWTPCSDAATLSPAASEEVLLSCKNNN